MSNPTALLIRVYQEQIQSLQAENESLRTQLHRSAQREDRDLELIRGLEQRLAEREVPNAA